MRKWKGKDEVNWKIDVEMRGDEKADEGSHEIFHRRVRKEEWIKVKVKEGKK